MKGTKTVNTPRTSPKNGKDEPEVRIEEVKTVPSIVYPSVKSRDNILKGKVAVSCLVLYPKEKGGIKPQMVYDSPESVIWRYKNMSGRLLRLNEEGHLEIYTPFGKEIGMPSYKLSRCRQCLPAQKLLRMGSKMLEKAALWAIVVGMGIGALLIIVIMGKIKEQGAGI